MIRYFVEYHVDFMYLKMWGQELSDDNNIKLQNPHNQRVWHCMQRIVKSDLAEMTLESTCTFLILIYSLFPSLRPPLLPSGSTPVSGEQPAIFDGVEHGLKYFRGIWNETSILQHAVINTSFRCHSFKQHMLVLFQDYSFVKQWSFILQQK